MMSRLAWAIEVARSEMTARLLQTECSLNDARLLYVSRKLDRLINLYYRSMSSRDGPHAWFNNGDVLEGQDNPCRRPPTH